MNGFVLILDRAEPSEERTSSKLRGKTRTVQRTTVRMYTHIHSRRWPSQALAVLSQVSQDQRLVRSPAGRDCGVPLWKDLHCRGRVRIAHDSERSTKSTLSTEVKYDPEEEGREMSAQLGPQTKESSPTGCLSEPKVDRRMVAIDNQGIYKISDAGSASEEG